MHNQLFQPEFRLELYEEEFGKNNRGHLLLQTKEFCIYLHVGCPQNFSRIPNKKKAITSEFFFKNSSRIPNKIPIKIPDFSLEKQLKVKLNSE